MPWFPGFPPLSLHFARRHGDRAVAISTAHGAEKKGSSMSYAEAREFLAKHTDLIELTNDAGAGWPSPRHGRGG